MAVIANKERVILKLELDGGVVDGRQRVSSKSINNIKLDATDDAIHGTGAALTNLQNKDVLNIKKIEEMSLEESLEEE